MALLEWARMPAPWCAGGGGAHDPEPRVLFTRSVRRRNFGGFSFWVSATPEACSRLAVRARTVAESMGLGREFALADYAPEALSLFREKQWLPERPVSFPGKRDFKRLYLGDDPADQAWLGEVEHWTRIRVHPGLPLAWEAPTDASLETPFCRSHEIGFLTSNPAHAGTGLQIECGLHLPALTAARRMAQIGRALNALGFELQPLTVRHPGSAEAGFFRLATRGGMDLSEENLYRRFTEKVKSVIAVENEAERAWQEREKQRLEDRIFRSLRLLQEARSLGYAEFLTFISFARLGAYLGHFEASLLPRLEALRVGVQPFHVAAQIKPGAPGDADIFRANVVRSGLDGAGPGV